MPLDAGDNPLRIVARTTGGETGERDWTVRYDATAAKDLFLEQERERIRRVRARKQLVISAEEAAAARLGPPSSPAPRKD